MYMHWIIKYSSDIPIFGIFVAELCKFPLSSCPLLLADLHIRVLIAALTCSRDLISWIFHVRSLLEGNGYIVKSF